MYSSHGSTLDMRYECNDQGRRKVGKGRNSPLFPAVISPDVSQFTMPHGVPGFPPVLLECCGCPHGEHEFLLPSAEPRIKAGVPNYRRCTMMRVMGSVLPSVANSPANGELETESGFSWHLSSMAALVPPSTHCSTELIS